MANGTAKGILQLAKEIHGAATPQYKLRPTGLLAYLLSRRGSSNIKIKNDLGNGHRQSVDVLYRKPLTTLQTSTAYDCDETNVQLQEETSVSVANYRQIAIGLNVDDVRILESYASNPTSLTSGQMDVMYEFYDRILTGVGSSLVPAINSDLVTLALAAVGVNAENNSTTKTINLPQDTTVQPLNDGITEFWEDWQVNGFTGSPNVIGAGLFSRYMKQQGAKSFDQTGFNTAVMANGITFWYDKDVNTATSNAVIAYEDDAVHLVDYLKNRGSFAGRRANSTFFTMPLPVMTYDKNGNQTMQTLTVDAQLKEYDCNDNIPNAYGGGNATLTDGYNLILGLNFGLYTIPDSAYHTYDPMTGNRGSLKYVISNECDSCS